MGLLGKKVQIDFFRGMGVVLPPRRNFRVFPAVSLQREQKEEELLNA